MWTPQWRRHIMSLNPCYNGIKMKVLVECANVLRRGCLNPCYNGIKMKVKKNSDSAIHSARLNPCYNGIKMKERHTPS